MSHAIGRERDNVNSLSASVVRLVAHLRDPAFRRGYLNRQFKSFLAAQIRSLRGNKTQAEFGRLIGKTQSVISRLENEHYGQVNINTLLDIALKLDVALIVRFVDYPTFLDLTRDSTRHAEAPSVYEQGGMDRFVEREVARENNGALKALFSLSSSHAFESEQNLKNKGESASSSIREHEKNAYEPERKVA
jgi:transcriptional regulator with XRE-family HTH domain